MTRALPRLSCRIKTRWCSSSSNRTLRSHIRRLSRRLMQIPSVPRQNSSLKDRRTRSVLPLSNLCSRCYISSKHFMVALLHRSKWSSSQSRVTTRVARKISTEEIISKLRPRVPCRWPRHNRTNKSTRRSWTMVLYLDRSTCSIRISIDTR